MSATAASRSFLRSTSSAARMASAQKAGSKPAFSPFRISKQCPFSPRIVRYQKLWRPRNAIGLNKMRKGFRPFSTEIVVTWILLYLCMKIFGFLITWSLSICFYPLQNGRKFFFYPYVGQCRPRWRSSDERWDIWVSFVVNFFFF